MLIHLDGDFAIELNIKETSWNISPSHWVIGTKNLELLPCLETSDIDSGLDRLGTDDPVMRRPITEEGKIELPLLQHSHHSSDSLQNTQ
jgi:hypothetical protein